MQVKEGSFRGDRPPCPRDGRHRVHRHGSYPHYQDCDSARQGRVLRFLCVICGRTISVVPDTRLPYRSVGLQQVQAGLAWRFGGGPAPPEGSERERGCVKRALQCFESHSPALRHALGQIVQDVGADATALWRTLGRLSTTGPILRFLQEKLKPLAQGHTRRGFSLLGTYRCLAVQPFSTA